MPELDDESKDLDLRKFNHLVPCGQVYDWRIIIIV